MIKYFNKFYRIIVFIIYKCMRYFDEDITKKESLNGTKFSLYGLAGIFIISLIYRFCDDHYPNYMEWTLIILAIFLGASLTFGSLFLFISAIFSKK